MNTISKVGAGAGVESGRSRCKRSPPCSRCFSADMTPTCPGRTLTETTLNASNVGSNTFGLLFKLPVDERVFAQPLYVPNVAIPNSGTHNVLYVATMNDSVYAFDADVGGAPLVVGESRQSRGVRPRRYGRTSRFPQFRSPPAISAS